MDDVSAGPLLVRMPVEVKQLLRKQADENGRSMASQIIQLIKAERARSQKQKDAQQ